MKKIYSLLLILLTFFQTSCVEVEDLFNYELVEKYKMTESIESVVEENYISIATFNGDTIYKGNVATMVDVPKITNPTSRNDVYSGLEWHFIPNGSGNYFYQKIYKGLAMFEDIPNGDCDYNDFVCKIGYQVDVDVDGNGYINILNECGLKLSITGIYPLAMGNTIPLKFGIEIVNLSNNTYLLDEILYEDVRTEAFRGESGFLNTVSKNYDPRNANLSAVYNVIFPPQLDKNGFGINFYIVANGRKHYMVNSQKADLTQNHTPWGIFIPISDSSYYNPNDLGFRYPKENISLFETYPNFIPWTNGERNDPFSDVVEENLFHF